MVNGFHHKSIEKKWQELWMDKKLYKADLNASKPYYMLVELTYTSGDLHMGHWFAWTAPDALARMKRMQGFNVLFPVGGFDAFGLPAENAAIKHGIHPRVWTYKNIDAMRKQFQKMGPSFDWDKEVITSDPEYYRWTQWLFLELYKSGLAYREKVWSNWCPECKTVLANEHVENGCCWRHTSTPVEQKLVDQWLFKITDYADKLIWPKKRIVDWPESMAEGQNKWIGRSEGITIDWEISNRKGEKITTFTTRPDTIFGVTFLVLSPEHPMVEKLAIGKKVMNYLAKALVKSARQRMKDEKSRLGVDTGYKAIHPFTGEEIPIWIADFVLAGYGTGAIMGVPAHDLRDWEFAQKNSLEMKPVITPADGSKWSKLEPFTGEGSLINSGEYSGSISKDAKEKISNYIETSKLGKRTIQYHLRDWSISRQRYWGAPVPIIYCKKCWENETNNNEQITKNLKEGIDYANLDGEIYRIRPVPNKNLPVTLPEEVDYTPTGKPPLATAEAWMVVKCPVCGSEAKREPETLDAYVDSCWYFFRYPTPHYNKGPFDKKVIKDWMPIEVYFGGPEHILGHTLFARFITKFLYDRGFIDFDEFAKRRVNHGVILGPDGFRMSKSRGNVVNPDDQVEKFGADAVRVNIAFMGPHDKGGSWTTEGIEGAFRFLNRVWRLFTKNKDLVASDGEDSQKILVKMHQTIKKVTNDIEATQTHTALASIMEFVNILESTQTVTRTVWEEALNTLCKLLAPFAPHITEEIWVEVLKQPFSVHRSSWPKFDINKVKLSEVEIVIQINGKLRSQLQLGMGDPKDKETITKLAKGDSKVSKWLGDAKIKKTVYIEGKLINFVV